MEQKSNKTEEGKSSRKRKIDEIHDDLKYDLAFEHLHEQSAKKFRCAASKHLSLADRSNNTEPFDIMERLEATGNLGPGQYKVIRQIGEKIKENNFVAAIDEAVRKITKIEEDGEESESLPHAENDRFTNIIAQTKRELETHLSDSSFVPLPVIDHIEKVLHQKGLVVLVGPSGCGKTKSVLQILSKVKTGRVMKLQRLYDWPEMVHLSSENWVWFDDVFQYDSIDRNKSIVETIKACVYDGNTKVLFTVMSEIFEKYKPFFSGVLSKEHIINFGDSEHDLSLEMRSKILHAHLSFNKFTICKGERPGERESSISSDNRKYIYENDIQEILLKKSKLGFPQSCHIFCRDLAFIQRGPKFFDDPSDELLTAMTNMMKSESEQFVTLLYTFRNGGKIDLNSLNESEISTLFADVSAPSPTNIESCIRRNVEILRGKFLVERSIDSFEFSHSSVQRAIALSYSKTSKSAKIAVISTLSTPNIVDMVKANFNHTDSSLIYVPVDLHQELVDLFTVRIKEGDFSLFQCSVFKDNDFIATFTSKYQMQSENFAENLKFTFRYGMMNFAKAILGSRGLNIEDLKDDVFSMVLKESSVYRHLSAVLYLIHNRNDSPQKTAALIKGLEYSIQNNEITSILLDNLHVSMLDHGQIRTVLKVLTRNETFKAFRCFLESLEMESEMLGYIANLAGRRNAHSCIKHLLERYSSDMNDILTCAIKGACKGGHDRMIDWAIEYYPEIMNKDAASFLQHIELPSTLEKLYRKYSSVISKLECSDALNSLCSRGKCLCVKVFLDICGIFSDADIQNAIRAAIRKDHIQTVNVIMETFSIPNETITELIETVRSDNMRPHSAYPFTPAHTPASVLSHNLFTPCSYEQTQKRHSKALCLKRCRSNQYLSDEANVYSKAYKLLSLIRDKNINEDCKLQQCKNLLDTIPENYEDLITDSAVHSLNDKKFLSLFIRKYPPLWKRLFKSCRVDKKQTNALVSCSMKHQKGTDKPFLLSLLEFASTNNENMSIFIQLLVDAECTFDIEKFITTLNYLIVSNQDTAEILLKCIEDLTLENSMVVPLSMSCKSNQMNVFKFIWTHIENRVEVFLRLLSFDISDDNGQALAIMLPDIKNSVGINDVLLTCFQKHARKWLTILDSTHHQQLADATEYIKSSIQEVSDSGALALMIKYLDYGRKESYSVLHQACRDGWQNVIKAVLEKNRKIAGGIIIKSIDILVKAKHHDLLFCFEESLKECRLTTSQCDKLLDLLVKNCSICNSTSALLQRLVLIPCFSARVFSNKIISVIGQDYFIKHLRKLLIHVENYRNFMVASDFHEFGSSLTVNKQQHVISIILDSTPENDQVCDALLSKFLPCCKEIPSDMFIRMFKSIDIKTTECLLKHNKDDIDDYSLEVGLNALLQRIPHVFKSSVVVGYIMDRRVDIASSASALFTCICEDRYTANRDTQMRLLRYMMETYPDIIKENLMDELNKVEIENNEAAIERLKVFQEHINLHKHPDLVNSSVVVDYIMERRVDIASSVSALFTYICKDYYTTDRDPQMRFLRYIMETYPDIIKENLMDELNKVVIANDEADLEILKVFPEYIKLHQNPDLVNSSVVVDYIMERRVDIASSVSALFTYICKDYFTTDRDPQMRLLRYIMETYPDIIKENLMDELNKVVIINNEAAVEILKVFPEHIKLHKHLCLVNSSVVVDYIMERRLDIASSVSSCFTFICENLLTADRDPQMRLLRYIMETYPDIIKDNLMDELNKIVIINNEAAVEIFKVFPEYIKLHQNPDLVNSSVVVDYIMERRLDIASSVSACFTYICKDRYTIDRDPQMRFLRFIIETYPDIIRENLMDEFIEGEIDNIEAGIEIFKVFPEHIKLHQNPDLVNSSVFVNTIMERRLDIASSASALLTYICKDSYRTDRDPQMRFLRYIMETYPDVIKDNLMYELNQAVIENDEAAEEIFKAFPEHIKLHQIPHLVNSSVVVNNVMERRLDIAPSASALFTYICKDRYTTDRDPQMRFLRYIIETYPDIIKDNLMDGFKDALIQNKRAAVEICKLFPEHIKLSEHVVLLFLKHNDLDRAYRIELLNQLSDILHVDKTMCMKFAEETIPEEERWRAVRLLFGSAITEDITWRLICLCCERRVYKMKEIFSHSEIKLTGQQKANLKKKYPRRWKIILPYQWF